MSDRRQLTHKAWLEEGSRLYGAEPTTWRFRCVKCNGTQSVMECMEAGMAPEQAFFSCIGRYKAGIGCDWTLGGLFRIHTLEVIDDEGVAHAVFEFADSEAARKEGAA